MDTPPQRHTKGQRQALDAHWLTYLDGGGHAGDGATLNASQPFAAGLSQINGGSFFEAHESFEQAWRDAAYPERLLPLALSKLGAALAHAERGNTAGAAKIARDALRFLRPLPVTYGGTDIAALKSQVERWLYTSATSVISISAPRA